MTEDSNSNKTNKGGRPRKGSLEWRGGTWQGRLTVTVDGESIRKWVRLETDSKPVARRKLARLLAEQGQASIETLKAEAARPETYAEVAKRVAEKREKLGRDVYNERIREKLWVLPEIGHLPIKDIRVHHIAGIYEAAETAGKARGLLAHLRALLRSRFAIALEEELIASNPMERVKIPSMVEDKRERIVLTDDELGIYLAWQHPEKHRQLAVLERQTMSAISRCYGGLRAGDLHQMQWSHFNAPDFTMGTALRCKTKRPQQIAVPELLRPVLKAWWHEMKQPKEGPIFPALRGEHAGKGIKQHVSHAGAMRRDLKRAFGLEVWDETEGQFVPAKNREMTARENEILNDTDFTRCADFHSWRRAFAQAGAKAGLTAQQAQRLTGHSSLSAHERYLRSTDTIVIPVSMLPEVLPQPIAKTQSTIGENLCFIRGAVGDRTPDLRTASAALSQLSYSPKREPKDTYERVAGEEIRHRQAIFLSLTR
jgi:integrase